MMRSLLRAGFMHAEALFNRAFGDRLNPLYHLGAIAFWLFWVVAGSGLYLYIFFDTSVAGAHASVQALATRQPWAGGLLRSVHRYASDAMVIAMLAHLMRYWAFDRLRGFRAWSWLTGVVLLWLVGIAGANGYMLPWDRLAQFVTQASFEWLDVLPGLGGTLVRNVIADERVSDRFFSLLVFIHIGVPLVTLLLMWVHVQRVPKAETQPPRPIAIALAVMLLALALLQPVIGQGGPAHLADVPATLALDWWLLGLYPLVEAWGPGTLWGAVLGATLLLLAAPWLPPRRRGAALNITLGERSFPARSGETLLEAGLRAGVPLPYDCRAGGCGVCVCTVLQGRVDPGPYQPAALTDAMRARGQVLACCATALEDLALELPPPAGADAPQRHRARIDAIDRLAPDVLRLWLTLEDGARIHFAAGQYLNIVLEDGERRAYSFANAPHDNERIELHVRRVPGGRFTTRAFKHLKPGDMLDIEGPFGRFTLQDGHRPMLFIAGATGFAPIKSIVEDALARGIRRPIALYWGVRKREDLYMPELPERWAREHPQQIRFVAALSEPPADGSWSGRTGLVHDVLLQDLRSLKGYELYACGSVAMIDNVLPRLLASGLDEAHCHSDAFVPANRRGLPVVR
ncbi:2Fe-2S iron-sulfur cluster-binding protein [Aquabacterium humicola]|uniref:2Fe-2S iron-sulfur cluster-binding protein n=1 Tax=Aquabacterium humicola TaxID=3237377 RepID=UPI002543E510|nr:2Fe-2S iron-sulfur cluster-binding protein [Rubrivivax pictus]